MTQADPKSLEEIVNEARTMPPRDQLRFVRNACAADDVLYQSAVQKLQSRQRWFDEDVECDYLEQADPLPDVAGQLIGPYRIVRSLGQGGMGEVFLAERADDQFRQQVAIKLVRRGLLSRHIQGRLRQERQILATLDHPNIARLFDGGATPDGTPYIVMEYVDGEPIDIYCDKRSLTIEQRLRLFKTVCSAVHRAHQNLIVHRDLKPSNILVTADGTPKLLDFGIAKMLDERHLMHTMAVTQADVRVMTPDHASPEQIRGEPVTTASDIYVLGVLFYELLSGYKPFVLRGTRLAELERAICEDTPLPPSTAIAAAESSEHSAVAEVAAQRSVSPAKLRRELKGDLDNIALMAMRKESERRYSSVEQFAADIDRHLNALPVLARADAWTYRTGKFIRRHAVVVGLSAVFVAVLIGFTITTLMQSRRIEHERDVAQAERATAQAERERAAAVSQFLIDSFRLADPSRARGSQITAREILDRGAARISSELRDQPALQATLLDTIGGVYLGLGLPSDAQPLIEQGLSVRRALFGEKHLEVAQSLSSLNRVYEKQNELQKAEAVALESLAINRNLTGNASLETASSLCQLGVIEHRKGELSRAEQLFTECLNIRIARLGRDNELITPPLDNLARLAQDRQDYARAESLYREAVEIDLRTRGEDHPQYIRHLENLATAIQGKGDLKAAESLHRRAIDLFQRILGPNHPETVDAMSNMGSLLLDQDQLDEAQKIFESVLQTNRKIRGERHAYVGQDLANLGRLAYRKQQFAVAEQRFNAALDIYREALPAGHAYTAAAQTMLGRSLLELGQVDDAEAALTSALESWSIEYGQKSIGYAITNAYLGRTWALQGRFADAERVLTQSYPIVLKSPPRFDRNAATDIRQWIESVYKSLGRPAAAAEYFAKVQTSA